MKKFLGLLLAFFLLQSAVFSADFKISQLAAKGSVAGSEQIPVNDAGVNKTITPSNIGTYLGSATQTLTNKTLTAPVISTISNSGTLTLPTGTRTLVGRDTTDTLTNKTISGASNTITNVSLTTGVTGTLGTTNGGMGTTNTTTFLNTIMSPTGHSGEVWGSNGTTGGWVSASAASCAGCVVNEIQSISGVTVDNSANDEGAVLDAWIETHKTNRILHIPPGVYDFSSMVGVVGLSNFKFECDPGAIFRKKAAMDDGFNEYFFTIVQSTNVTFEGCRFEGLTTSATEYNAGEQGITCLSCDGFYVSHNYFKDIGDAAVRSSSYPTGGVPSVNTWITNNVFENISQITTTPASGSVQGTSNIWVVNNKFIDIKWSVKMCTRATGASGIHIIGNEINNSDEANLTNHDTGISAAATGAGVELCSVSDVWVENNHITDSRAAAIHTYTNPSVNHFDWGNWHISGNTIKNSPVGIKVNNQAGLDGLYGTASAINVHDNTIIDITGAGAWSIWFLGTGGFQASQAHHNIIVNPTSGLYKTIPGSGVTYADNIED